jgi:hypothetical protein
VAGEDLGGRLRRGIDRLIGVAAGKDERGDHERDAEPRGAAQLTGAGQWNVRLVAAQEKSAITRSVARVAISLNNARSTLIRRAARNTRLVAMRITGGNVGTPQGSGENCH